MQNITTVVGKLLYFARHLHQTKQISQGQLALLKDMIIGDNEDVNSAFEEYLNQGTELTLASSLIRLIHHQKDSESEGEKEKQNSQSSGSKKQRSRKGSIKVIIPKRNIQKMPVGMGRI